MSALEYLHHALRIGKSARRVNTLQQYNRAQTLHKILPYGSVNYQVYPGQSSQYLVGDIQKMGRQGRGPEARLASRLSERYYGSTNTIAVTAAAIDAAAAAVGSPILGGVFDCSYRFTANPPLHPNSLHPPPPHPINTPTYPPHHPDPPPQ